MDDDTCARCGAPTDSLQELHRFGTGGGVARETVCESCCTRLEQAVSRRVPDDPELQAFILALTDSIDRLHATVLVNSPAGS